MCRTRAHAINVAAGLTAAARQAFGTIGRWICALDARYAEYSIQQCAIYISIYCEQEYKKCIIIDSYIIKNEYRIK